MRGQLALGLESLGLMLALRRRGAPPEGNQSIQTEELQEGVVERSLEDTNRRHNEGQRAALQPERVRNWWLQMELADRERGLDVAQETEPSLNS